MARQKKPVHRVQMTEGKRAGADFDVSRTDYTIVSRIQQKIWNLIICFTERERDILRDLFRRMDLSIF